MTKLSVETFIEQTENGNIDTAKVVVYRELKFYGTATLGLLRQVTGMSHQTLTARLSELMDIGVVWQNDRNAFYTTEKHQWSMYADVRREERYKKWLKVGQKEGFVVSETLRDGGKL